ncbi:MAG: hypothetical protein FWE11_00850 [Defluviitaleaceae bacterium]|nr:hypothetical protein [Defluviitaleaceae bacterium]
MKKVIMALFLAIVVVGLTACGNAAEYQEDMLTPAADERHISVPGGNADTNTAPNVYQGVHEHNPPSNEILAGTVQAIDGMSLTIDTSSVFVANETGHHTATGEPQEPQQKIIRLTEQTTIEVRATSGGQIVGSEIGTLDDLSLYAVVMAEGEWQDNEFVATTLIIMNF